MIKHSSERPPNWATLIKLFPTLHWEDGVIVTWGNTYHSQSEIEPDFIVHEETHTRQQEREGGPENWWNKFYADPVFRLHQEVEAYQNQYDFLKESFLPLPRKERKFKLRKIAEWMAMTLSGEIYGGMVTYDRALGMIKD